MSETRQFRLRAVLAITHDFGFGATMEEVRELIAFVSGSDINIQLAAHTDTLDQLRQQFPHIAQTTPPDFYTEEDVLAWAEEMEGIHGTHLTVRAAPPTS